jgi:hypothetical protein
MLKLEAPASSRWPLALAALIRTPGDRGVADELNRRPAGRRQPRRRHHGRLQVRRPDHRARRDRRAHHPDRRGRHVHRGRPAVRAARDPWRTSSALSDRAFRRRWHRTTSHGRRFPRPWEARPADRVRHLVVPILVRRRDRPGPRVHQVRHHQVRHHPAPDHRRSDLLVDRVRLPPVGRGHEDFFPDRLVPLADATRPR